jgi:hypothetical protein
MLAPERASTQAPISETRVPVMRTQDTCRMAE